jgi:fibronectin-binding autotransporter adhesin
MNNPITGTYGTLVTLASAFYNPTTITSTGLLTDGVSVSYTGLALVNAGRISAGSNFFGIEFRAAGSVTNQSGGTISGGDGVYGKEGAAVTVVNAGTIAGSNGEGIRLIDGGSVTNQSGGTISGSLPGIELTDGGSVTNQSGGAISGGYGISGLGGAVTVVNAGSITGHNYGVRLFAGGSVTNQSGGAISGSYGVSAGGAVTVVNAGTITGGTDAVKFAASYANRLVIDPGAVFTGTVTGGNTIGATYVSTLELASGASAGALSGLGTKYVDFAQVMVDARASWTLNATDTVQSGVTLSNYGTLSGTVTLAAGGVLSNASTGTVTMPNGTAVYGATGGAATVVNAGVIAGSDAVGGLGIDLAAGGSVTNQSGGAISGYHGIYGKSGAVTVVNAGSIAASGFDVYLRAGGSVTNQRGGAISGFDGIFGKSVAMTVVNAGSIAGDVSGVLLDAGGSVTNQSGGAISGGSDGIISFIAAVTVVNAGTISGVGSGVYVRAGGSVTNQSGGAIRGDYGIYGYRGAVTVVNAGTISGGLDAVKFEAGSANRLVIDPGAVFSGKVTGGNTIGATQYSTLELASGASAGTLSGIGTQFVDFAQTTIDSGAYWILTGTNTIAAGATVTNDGTLAIAPGGTLLNAGSIAESTAGGTGVNLQVGASVTNQSGGTITGGSEGIKGLGGAVTVVNTGGITGGVGGVYLTGGGSVTNQSGGAISGEDVGIVGVGGAVTVVNAGSIIARVASGGGIDLHDGGSVTNQSGGTISGVQFVGADGSVTNQSGGAINGVVGIEGQSAAVIVMNAGSIAGNTTNGGGILLFAGGNVTNHSGDSISGEFGIYSTDGAVTVVNAGTIAGSTDAVYFAAGLASRLIADPGAVFTGNVNGGGGVLELASAASAGTLSGFGTSITNFSALQFDAGAAWTVSGTDSASGLGTIAITGLANGDTIDLTGFLASGDTFANNTLVLTGAGGAEDTLAIQGAFTSSSFQLSKDGNGGTDIVVCFCAGTMIATPAGEVRVEKLNIGDMVLTAQNGPRLVKWIGNGKVLATRGRRTAATPVIVRKGALADNVPNADLRVTKAHSLYIDDVLIPVEYLVNHQTILWDDRAQEVDIYHVELDSHDVLIANGAPAESYRDDGNRWLFQNARSGWDLPPQEPYAPVLTGGPVVDTVWQRLLDRTGPRALPSLTDDPDLHLVVDGTRVDAEERQGSVHVFALPSRPTSVVIASRAGVPSELGTARDPRPLGVAVRRVAIRQGTRFMLLDAADERLTVGFHAYEADSRLRWTDGYAELPANAFTRFDQGAEVMLHLGGTARYPDDRADAPRSAA